MKYYAVTEDPRELYHYGVKGMKWGQHLFGDDLRPKSPAYKKAASKLRESLKNTKSAIQKNAAQAAYNRRARQDQKYAKAIQKSQQRMALVSAYNNVDKQKAYDKQMAKYNAQVNKDRIAEQKAAQYALAKSNARRDANLRKEKKSIKNEKHMEKILQEAREGRLRYGKLTEDQIGRVQDRLQIEQNARRLGGSEKMSWRKQKKEARRAGILQGITRGTSAAMEEVARAGVQYGIQNLANRRKLNAEAKYEGKRERIKNRERNKKTHADIKRDLDNQLYEEQIKSGVGVLKRATSGVTAAQKGEALKNLQRQSRIQDNYQKYLDDHGITEKQAEKQYLTGLSAAEKKNYNKADKYAKQALLLDSTRKQREEQERNEKFETEIKDSRKNKYKEALKNTNLSDKELREAFGRSLPDIASREAYNNMTADEQREAWLKNYEATKADQKVADEAQKRKEEKEELAKQEAAYLHNQMIQVLQQQYKDAREEYNKELQQWIKNGRPANKRPVFTMKAPPVLSFEDYRHLPHGGNNGGGGKNR